MTVQTPLSYVPQPPARRSSLQIQVNKLSRSNSASGSSIYQGVSNRPLGWKSRKTTPTPTPSRMGRDANIRRWDGAARKSSEWDGLRRDPELWYPEGNCLVHLYGRGQSRRGPAFRIPFEALIATRCRPLLDRFMVESFSESPVSDISSGEDGGYFGQPYHRQFELYIPAPASAERGQAFLYHAATRNFFAWIFGKPLVGTHLGGALVGLLNSMNEFRSIGEDNVEAIMDYMDEEGYADMRNQADHALGVLFFAEHFQFRDLWIDAFAHCTGMNDILITSAGFEHMSRQTRAFITRSRLEMDMRLDHCGRKLTSFLSEDLSETHLNLSTGERAHMDRFRTFLQSYYVAKLGYYPPAATVSRSFTFPSNVYRQMCVEFQKLYDLLVDTELTISDTTPISRQGGICVLQSVQSFDQRNKYQSLPHPFPLLPELEDVSHTKTTSRRFSWVAKQDKMTPDGRLVALASMTKATNRKNVALYDCSLVRAYRGFEKECIFAPTKADKSEKLSQTEARKVRWILIYSTLQTLRSVTQVPKEVRDVHNVPYNLCVQTAGCPPWKHDRPIATLLRTQTDQTKEDYIKSMSPKSKDSSEELKPDIDYRALQRAQPPVRTKSETTLASLVSKGTVRKALHSLGNMPELHHPRPKRASFHEILVHGYGNGTNKVHLTKGDDTVRTSNSEKGAVRKASYESHGSSEGEISSRWSNSTCDELAIDFSSPSPLSRSSPSPHDDDRRPSDVSSISEKPLQEFLEHAVCVSELDVDADADADLRLTRVSSSVYSQSVYEGEHEHEHEHIESSSFSSSCPPSPTMTRLHPAPLQITKSEKSEMSENVKMLDDEMERCYMTIRSDVVVEYETKLDGNTPEPGLLTHISCA